jgi:cell division protein FtsW
MSNLKNVRKSKFLTFSVANSSLLFCLGALIIIGLVALYSASYPLGMERYQDGTIYLRKQLVFLIIGMMGLGLAARIPYRYWSKLSYPLLGLAIFLLALLWVPGLGVSVGGARRWLSLGGLLGGLRFQPAEFAKFALMVYLVNSVFKKQGRMNSFAVGVLPHILIPSVILCLVLVQPDFGTFMTLAFFIFIMLYIGGARILHLGGLVLGSMPLLYFLVFQVAYRRRRFLSFLNPWADVGDSGFQIIQSHLAMNRGGLTGVGLGEGQQKMLFLPDIHTDFIFSVIGEEMGFVGVALVVMLFFLFTLMGMVIAVKAYRQGALYACYLAAGMTLLIAVPAFVNMAVVLGLLPTKGMVLPFLSYGGSALIMALLGCGILLNLSREDSLQEPSLA